MSAPWQDQMYRLIDDCMVPNWDSYQADPISQAAIDSTRGLIESIGVMPTKKGGVTIYLASEGITVDITSDGRIASVYLDVEETNDWLAIAEASQGKK